MGGCYNFCCGKCSNILFSGLNPTHTIQMILYSLIGSGSLCYFLRNKITFKFFYHPHTFVFIKPKQSWNVHLIQHVQPKRCVFLLFHFNRSKNVISFCLIYKQECVLMSIVPTVIVNKEIKKRTNHGIILEKYLTDT